MNGKMIPTCKMCGRSLSDLIPPGFEIGGSPVTTNRTLILRCPSCGKMCIFLGRMIKTTFEQMEITYNEATNRWKVDDDTMGFSCEAESLDKVKKRITEFLRNRKTGRFKKQPALKLGGRWDYGRQDH